VLGAGQANPLRTVFAGDSRVLGCDLSYEYVRINGEYTT